MNATIVPGSIPSTHAVYIIDDDDAMRQGMMFLLRSSGLTVECFSSGPEFLAKVDASAPGCILLDVRMPGMSGLELQEELVRRGIRMPVILVTGHGNVPMAVKAMRSGAFDFVEKPFEGPFLLERIRLAIAADVEARGDESRLRELRDRVARLTPREREVMALVVEGMLNKQIAASLNISMKTVENHRAHVMEKLGANSLADLVRMAVSLGQ
jgi:FixJ family two-component response regulator